MKPSKLFHDDDVMCCLEFDDGTIIYWNEDAPIMIQRLNSQPELYVEGTIPVIDELMSEPAGLYDVPAERMDQGREQNVRRVLRLC